MTELKTLKDLQQLPVSDFQTDHLWVDVNKLKQEAIKWYQLSKKEIAFDERRHQQLSGIGEFIKEFFNLTEEDLQ